MSVLPYTSSIPGCSCPVSYPITVYNVVEVLSPTTELTGRTWKLKNYRAHPTIEEYVLVDSRSFKIEIYHKEQNKWMYEAFENSDDITLSSLGVHFSLVDAYTDIEFEETTEDTNQ